MRDRTRAKRLLRRLFEAMRRRRRKPVIDRRVTADDIRRAEELIEKYWLHFLREDGDER